MYRFLAAWAVFLNACYLLWLPFHTIGFLGYVFFFAESIIISMSFLFVFNHWSQKHSARATASPHGTVDIFITVVNEPLALFERVVRAASKIDYAKKQVYILDDGGRREVKDIALTLGAHYISRPNKPEYYKAGNLNYALKHSRGDYILVLDADQEVIDLHILKELLGHFTADDKLSLVTTRQRFDVPVNDFNHDYLFYEHMQSGKNADNAAISTGSGVIYSRNALKAIGGFQTWNIVEDMYTAYQLHAAGFNTLYINKSYTLGTAPLDLATIYKQRGTWALDTLRMFFKDNPFIKPQLTLSQRLHYTELALVYIVSAVAVPILYFLPIFSLLFDIHVVNDPIGYILLRIPSLILLQAMYYYLSNNSVSATQFWAGLSPVYLKALALALLPGKPRYTVTNKVNEVTMQLWLILPHLVLVILALFSAPLYAYHHGVDGYFIINTFFIMLMLFWSLPIIMKGFGYQPLNQRPVLPDKVSTAGSAAV